MLSLLSTFDPGTDLVVARLGMYVLSTAQRSKISLKCFKMLLLIFSPWFMYLNAVLLREGVGVIGFLKDSHDLFDYYLLLIILCNYIVC